MTAADADLDLVEKVLALDHLPRTVSSLDGADVEDGNGHQEGGGEDHRLDAADLQLKGW